MFVHMYLDASSPVLFHCYKFFFFNIYAFLVVEEKFGFVIVQICVMSSEIGNPIAALYFWFMKLFVKLQIILINVLSTVINSFRIIFLMWVSFRVLLKMLIVSPMWMFTCNSFMLNMSDLKLGVVCSVGRFSTLWVEFLTAHWFF
jgi:hypothetical protein